jgi:hypothetical protein
LAGEPRGACQGNIYSVYILGMMAKMPPFSLLRSP